MVITRCQAVSTVLQLSAKCIHVYVDRPSPCVGGRVGRVKVDWQALGIGRSTKTEPWAAVRKGQAINGKFGAMNHAFLWHGPGRG